MSKILVIDDETEMRELLGGYLSKRLKFSVLLAKNGEEGLALYQQGKPDVVLLDIVMPIMQGYEVLEKLLVIDPKAQIIVITGYNNLFPEEEAMKLGAKGYIIKPLELEKLKKMIGGLTG